MARFTYDRYSWSSLAERASSLGFDLDAVAAWFNVAPDHLAEWKAEGGLVPTWLVVAIDVLKGADMHDFEEAHLGDFLMRWNLAPRTLARILGINPTTVKNWRKPEWHEPRYLGRLLGLIDTPRGLVRARISVGKLIAEDIENPGTRYPFKRNGYRAAEERLDLS